MLNKHMQRFALRTVYMAFGALVAITANAEQGHEGHDIVYLNSALKAVRSGDGAGALAFLSQQGEENLCPTHKAQHFGLACRAHLATGDASAARSACARAIESHDVRGNWRHYNNLGIAEFQLGNTAAAVQALETAVLQSGTVATPRKNLAAVRGAGAGDAQVQQVAARLQAR